ncbi:MAG: 3-phosphoshikimate 1-carboxyvinyltransferase [Ornithinimicrobium sp.]
MTIINVPGSKSITARALTLAAAASGRTTLIGALDSDDTDAFVAGLQTLGYDVTTAGDGWQVEGRPSGPSVDTASVLCRDGATTSRFLPALAACGYGVYAFDASDQMRRRPMEPLTHALSHLGVQIDFGGEPAHHPLTVRAQGVDGGGVRLDAGTSSQFLTALLMIGPLCRQGLSITVSDLVSAPYVQITVNMMRDFGIDVAISGDTYYVPHGTYRARTYSVEPDASSASYFFAAAAILNTSATIPGLGSDALQGDIAFVDVLRGMGADVEVSDEGTTVVGNGRLQGVTVNMRDISDTMPTLAAIAPFAEGPTTITDVYNTRVKECDRLESCAKNLRRMGVKVETGRDWIRIHPGIPTSVEIECQRDHRIAMAFSITRLRVPGLTLDDPTCVKKTFPSFHQDLAAYVESSGHQNPPCPR